MKEELGATVLSKQDRQHIADLWHRVIPPRTGFERHFLAVCQGRGRACTSLEKQWFEYWKRAVATGEHPPSASRPRPAALQARAAAPVVPTASTPEARPQALSERERAARTRELARLGYTPEVIERLERQDGKRRKQENEGYFASGHQGYGEPLFHRAGCSWVTRLDRDRAIVFSSREEARESGYRPCRHCKP